MYSSDAGSRRAISLGDTISLWGTTRCVPETSASTGDGPGDPPLNCGILMASKYLRPRAAVSVLFSDAHEMLVKRWMHDGVQVRVCGSWSAWEVTREEFSM